MVQGEQLHATLACPVYARTQLSHDDDRPTICDRLGQKTPLEADLLDETETFSRSDTYNYTPSLQCKL